MSNHCGLVGLCALLAAQTFAPAAKSAEFSTAWKVEGKLLGKVNKKDGKVKKAEDVSGIACATPSGFPRHCLVIDDELQAAQLVTLEDGKIIAGKPITLISDKHDGKPVEFDGEGVAYDNGYFYVIGSHGHPRDADKELNPDDPKDKAKIASSIATSSRIIRVRIDPATGASEVTLSARLRELIAADDVLKQFMDKRLDENGLTIEGVAIHDGRLYAGFRGPSDVSSQSSVILSAKLGAFFEGAQPDALLHLLPLGKGQGVRDLARTDDGLLILAGPTADGGNNDTYAVFRWDGTSKDMTPLGELPRVLDGEEQLKPEALLPLDRDGSGRRVLIMFDGAKEGEPRAIRIK